MKIDRPGIYRGISSADYFADPCPQPSLSQSIAKVLLDRSALHAMYEHPRLRPAITEDDGVEKYDKAKAIGNAAHSIMLGRGKDVVKIDFKDFRKDDAKVLRDAAYADGRTPILSKHFDIATEIVAAGWSQLKHHEDKDAFTNGAAEVALIWQDEGTGIWCRALVDWLHDDLRTVDDYKTSGMSMAPHVIGLRAETAGWHVQAAFIERGLDALDAAGAGRRRFRFIGQEQDGRPYGLTSMHMDEHWLTMGRKKVHAAISMWNAAIRTGRWQGYPTRAVHPDYPQFRENQWLDRELSGEFDPAESARQAISGKSNTTMAG